MAPDQDDAVLPEGDLSSSSQDDEEEDVDVDEDEDDDVDDDDDVINSASPSSTSNSLPVAIATAAPTVTVALPAPHATTAPATTTTTAVLSEGLDPKRPRTIQYDPVLLPLAAPEEKKPAAALDDSRRLFQRLWTDEDEIELLQGFLDYTTQRGNKGGSHQNDTALFYDQIKSKLQLEFNKNQLVEKLRRLKKKYRNVLNKIASGKEVSFKSPHDQATFEISRKIWSNIGRIGVAGADDNDDEDPNPNPNNPNFNHFEIKTEEAAGFQKSTPKSRKRQRTPAQPKTPSFVEPAAVPVIKENHHNVNNGGGVGGGGGGGSNCGNCNVQGMIEETVKSCLSPVLRELMSSSMGGGGPSRGFGGLSLNPIPLSFGGPSMSLNFGGGEAADEQWRKQQILELEVYSKRLELVQNQIKVALDELRSTGGGG
ncbi:putative transcription factor GeBP family [Rosa chinensis]|uniref:Putative transcription factor GeBP family n=1 Tax=Rosa chinensis TaxID=74649 RepID=A0A2P6R683_ROSCH|nr:probable transcription factor At3g04930 [Rosa chinensis]XP_040372164.1 probable transcription factor At3g04930 [Rosa chinensis]PRQ41940.1 putative transcription factor GeBP family [Rosa chinensis]